MMRHKKYKAYQTHKRGFLLFSFISFFLFFLLTLLFEQSCFALQAVDIGENQTKKVSISRHDLSRIFVKDDRIQNVRGVEGAYILTKDAVLGQVFIKPTAPYQSKSFNLFITTEQGRNYNLFVTPAGIRGQDIELKPNTPSKKAVLWEKNSDYRQVLVQLIASMVNGEVPEGYSIVYQNSKNGTSKKNKENRKNKKNGKNSQQKFKPLKYGNVIITLQKQYVGNHLYVEVFLVKNRCKYQIDLNETMFYQRDVRAIALLKSVLPAGGQTMLFRVISVDNN